MYYDYRAGKKRMDGILDSRMEVIESDKLPKSDDLTFENSYHSWLTAVFVDIRNSTQLMADDDQEYVAKVVRCFTSELIEILRDCDLLREIGIRGDCVYAIYTTPRVDNIVDVFDHAVWCNSCLNMLNAVLSSRNLPRLKAGIGVAAGHDYIIKAGRKGVGINDHVWMGEAVSKASKLSGYGDKNGVRRIVISSIVYQNIIDSYKEQYPGSETWFSDVSTSFYGAKQCDVVMAGVEEWIKDGMD